MKGVKVMDFKEFNKVYISFTDEEIELMRDALYTEMIRRTANGQQDKGDQCFDLREKLYDFYNSTKYKRK